CFFDAFLSASANYSACIYFFEHPTEECCIQRVLVSFRIESVHNRGTQIRSTSGGFYAEEGRYQPSTHNQRTASHSSARPRNPGLRYGFARAAPRSEERR